MCSINEGITRGDNMETFKTELQEKHQDLCQQIWFEERYGNKYSVPMLRKKLKTIENMLSTK